MPSRKDSSQQYRSNISAWFSGALAVMPLSIAVIPWGILAGSLALDAGLSVLESQAMSAIVFAGAAQLVAVGMIKAGMGMGSILVTTFFILNGHAPPDQSAAIEVAFKLRILTHR